MTDDDLVAIAYVRFNIGGVKCTVELATEAPHAERILTAAALACAAAYQKITAGRAVFDTTETVKN